MKNNRRTGRTTRMLANAMEFARQGRAVYVIAATREHARTLEYESGPQARDLGIKFETPESLGNFNWESMQLQGAHPNCVVLVDHYTIEARFARMLEMLHRFDA